MKIIKSFNFKRAKTRKDKQEESRKKFKLSGEKIECDNKITNRGSFRN
jgi:hypothetical protein